MEKIISEKCRCCKNIKPIIEFAKNRNTKTGHYIYCRECVSNKYYQKKGIFRGRKIRRKIGVRNMREEAIKLLGGKCVRCGFSDIRALQIDHVNGGGRKELREFGQWNTYSKVYALAVEGKAFGIYQVLCANCNWIKRHENKEV